MYLLCKMLSYVWLLAMINYQSFYHLNILMNYHLYRLLTHIIFFLSTNYNHYRMRSSLQHFCTLTSSTYASFGRISIISLIHIWRVVFSYSHTIHIHTCMYILIYIHLYVNTYTCIYIYIHICLYICMNIVIYLSNHHHYYRNIRIGFQSWGG
jgi:hypothetical protein